MQSLELKIGILTNGIKISETAYNKLSENNTKEFTTNDYSTTSGLPMYLGENQFVNAPFKEGFAKNSKFTLIFQENNYFITTDNDFIKVSPLINPTFYNPDSLVNVHTDRARANPVEGCSMKCKICDTPYRNKYFFNSPEKIIRELELAINDTTKPAKHVLLSGGTPTETDYGIVNKIIKEVICAIKSPIDIMYYPRGGVNHLKYLYELGVNDLFINLEGTDESFRTKFMRQKNQLSVKDFLDYIEKAVDIFGFGRIFSIIIVGLEPIKNTLNAVELISRIGGIPVLSPFRPAIHTPLKNMRPPNYNLLKQSLFEALEICDKNKSFLGPKCIPCNHNVLNLPNGHFFKYY